MMSEDASTQMENLILGGRINWPYILGVATLKFVDVTVKVEGEQSEQEIREAALVLQAFIPDAWVASDQKYKDEIKKAIEQKEVDVRKEWCGRKIGEPKFEKIEVVDGHKLAHACVNVYQRRGLLSKTIFTEKIIPQPEDFEKKEE